MSQDGHRPPSPRAAYAATEVEADAERSQHRAAERAPTERPVGAATAGARNAAQRAADLRAKAEGGERERARPTVATDHGGVTQGVTAHGPTSGSGGVDGEQSTAHAGLFFLLPLASRLGMPAFLAAHREMIELDFPTRLLRHVADRLAIESDDPALTALLPVDDAAARWDGDFVAPDPWSGSVTASGVTWLVRRVVGETGDNRRALTDGSWRLVLALWRGKAPASVHALCAGAALGRGRPLRESTAMDILLGSWVTAMRRWCRRYAGMGLRTLVTRPGRIAATRTHLDVFFGLRQIDIGVRRAGLDIDPGWLPWFGRIVAYHYGREERTDAR